MLLTCIRGSRSIAKILKTTKTTKESEAVMACHAGGWLLVIFVMLGIFVAMSSSVTRRRCQRGSHAAFNDYA